MFYATNLNKGPYGTFLPQVRTEVSEKDAARLAYNREFRVEADPEGLRFRDENGAPRYLGFYGPLSARFGYGGASIDILHALTQQGIEVRVNPRYEQQLYERQDFPRELVRQLEKREWLPRHQLCHCLPDALPYAGPSPSIAWTMWETSAIPDGSRIKDAPFGDWATLLNQHAEHLIVPSQHNKELFAASGVELPISVLPYGVDVHEWPLMERPSDRSTFTVVLFGDLTERKAPFEALIAFQRAFPTESDVRLILKTQYGHWGSHHRPLVRDPRITLIDEKWSRDQLRGLLFSADCFLWPSRGEGFGLPPVQAMLTGLPVIMTNNTGMSEYFDNRYFYEIKSAGLVPAPLYGEWHQPDIDHAAAQLREVYTNYEKARRKALRGAGYLRKNFSLEAFSSRLGGFLATL